MTGKKTITVELDDAVEVDGKTYTSLTFRKLKGKDLLAADLVSGETRKGFATLASMAEVPITVIEELSSDDIEKIGQETIPLMGKSAADAVEAAKQKRLAAQSMQ